MLRVDFPVVSHNVSDITILAASASFVYEEVTDALHRVFRPYDPVSVDSALPPGYRSLPDVVPLNQPLGVGLLPTSDTLFYSKDELYDWASRPYPQNTHPFERAYYTANGTTVRSLGEVIVYNTLLSLGIPFRYEMQLPLRDADGAKTYRYPDFAIPTLRRGLLFWEVVGMLSDPGYRNSFQKKLLLYHDNNICLSINLIITSTAPSGTVDAFMIEQIARGILTILL